MSRALSIVLAAALGAGASACARSSLRGPIGVAVDASDAGRGVFHVSLKLPVSAGAQTLVYPAWVPGEHGPTGPLVNVVALRMSVDGRPLDWRRDDTDMYALHVTVPDGGRRLDISFDYLSIAGSAGFTSAASTTPNLAVLSWNQLVLAPAGLPADAVRIEPSLRLPRGWTYATALAYQETADAELFFAPVSLATLVDSPVLAGRFLRTIPLDQSAGPIELAMAADSEAALAAGPEVLAAMKQLVAEADALFGERPFARYRFLVALSDHIAHFGLEHHESSDNRLSESAVVMRQPALRMLAHEYAHAWNGKYRRPAGLATASFQEPMRGELLWVYEGLTQYLGLVLAARSGLISAEDYRELLAARAAALDAQPGRRWRPLADTAVAAQLLFRAPAEYASLRRGTDFYDEGWLIWLDADTQIRELTAGQKSLDDFCRRFHGGAGGRTGVRPYTRDDVVAALNSVAAFDWSAFFEQRVTRVAERAPLDGLDRAGWRLSYSNARNQALLAIETGRQRIADFTHSLGVRVADGGRVIDVIAGSPAAAAGLIPGDVLRTAAGRPYTPDGLRQAILSGAVQRAPVSVGVESYGATRAVDIAYVGGLREPHLARTGGVDRLAEILRPRTNAVR